MKHIITDNTALLELLSERFAITCNEAMQMVISDADAEQIDAFVAEFAPAAMYDYSIDDIYTYDVHFNDESDSNNKGFKQTFEYCKDYIRSFNGTNESYFADYKGGIVSIVCNETGETIYEEDIR